MLAFIYVLIAVAVRVVAGTGTFATLGFTPVGASLLFFGARMPRRLFFVPVALLIASDFYLNQRVYGMPLTWDQGLIFAWYAGACLIGTLLRNRIKPLYIGGAALGTAVSFFLISNFGVWASGYVGYPHTWGGLIACYTAAIPFFEKGIVSDLVFSAVFFGIPALYAYSVGASAEASEKNRIA